MFLARGIISVLALFLTNTSSLNGVFALDNSGYTFLDCVYDNGTNKEICCDGSDGNVKCLECDMNLETGEKSDCKEVPNKSEGKTVRPPDSVLDGNVLGTKDPVKQSQGLGNFLSSLVTSK